MEENKDLEKRIFEVELKENKLELNKDVLKHIMFSSDVLKILKKKDGKLDFVFKKKDLFLYSFKCDGYFCIYAIPEEILDDILNEINKNISEQIQKKILSINLTQAEKVTVFKDDSRYFIYLSQSVMNGAGIKENSNCLITKAEFGIKIYDKEVYDKINNHMIKNK